MHCDPDIARILQKLDEVRARGLTCFGSESHRFQLAPPLEEAEVARFEKATNTRLPAAYRRFLTQAGASGAGPCYGLEPLPESTVATSEQLARPCLLHPGLRARKDAWLDAIGRPDVPYEGTLAIGSEGCTGLILLVLNGPHQGRVVHVHDDVEPFPPRFADDEDFLGWYERWLDELLAGWDVTQFGRAMRGTAETFRHGALDAARSEEERARAVSGLLRLPALEPASVDVVLRVLRDDGGEARESAAAVAEHFELVDAAEVLRATLDDDHPAARAAAVRALAKLRGVDWLADARRMLRDPASPVVRAAVFALRGARAVRTIDVAPALASPDAMIRKVACWALAEVRDSAAIVALLERIEDPHESVRLNAAQAIGKHAKSDPVALAQSSAVAILGARLGVEPDPMVSLNLALTLGATRDASALPALTAAAAHAHGFVRQAVATALGELGDRRAIPTLEVLARDPTKPSHQSAYGGRGWSIHSVGDVARQALARLRGAPTA